MARDLLRTLFGLPAPDFRARVARRAALMRHGAATRLGRLLEEAPPRDDAGIAELIDGYGGAMETMRFDRRGVLRRLPVRASARDKMLARPQRRHFLYDYDAQFGGARRLLNALRIALEARPRGAKCLGTLHTARAMVPRHCDDVDVIAIQVMGTRRWCVEANSDPPQGLLDPVRWPRRLNGGWSQAFGAQRRVYALRPGSALYVPLGWWHETQSVGTSLALTFAFKRR